MVTIKDIASALNVTPATVSMALNDNPRISQKRKQEIIAKADELGYVKNGAASDLHSKKTNTILLVITDASRSFYTNLISFFQSECIKYGYNLIITPTIGSNKTAKKYISEHRCDGAMIFTNQIEDEFILKYARDDCPIFTNRSIKGKNILSISNVSTNQGRAATNFLLYNGFRRIAFVKGTKTTYGTKRRFEGYCSMLFQNNIPIDESIIYDAQESTFDAGYKISEQIINDLDKIDSIIYANDDLALGGLNCFLRHGIKVPDDISLIGHYNIEEGKHSIPSLTTASSSGTDLYKLGVEALHKAINHLPFDQEKIEKLSLNSFETVIVRETVKIRNNFK